MRRKFGEDRKKRTKQIKWLITNGRPRCRQSRQFFKYYKNWGFTRFMYGFKAKAFETKEFTNHTRVCFLNS